MLAQRKAVVTSCLVKEGVHILSLEIFSPAALLTNDEMLVSARGREVHVTAIRLVYALDQSQFLHFFEGAVYGDESQAGLGFASKVEQVHRAESMRATSHDLHNGAARRGETVSTLL